jgi:hypothetical protein
MDSIEDSQLIDDVWGCGVELVESACTLEKDSDSSWTWTSPNCSPQELPQTPATPTFYHRQWGVP